MSESAEEEFQTLIRLIPKLYFKLQTLTEQGVKGTGVSPGQRALMEDIDRLGPHSVGALAKMRPVAKQYVQKLVADLKFLGLVALIPNPADGRSKLVTLTTKGRNKIEDWRSAERDLVTAFLDTVSKRDVTRALHLMTQLEVALSDAIKVVKPSEDA